MTMPTEHRAIDCEEAIRHLAEYLDRELDDTRAAEVEQHLHVCRSCFSRAEFERRLGLRLRELGSDAADPEFEYRIRELARTLTGG